MSLRWTAYVASNPSGGGSKSRNGCFPSKIALLLKSVCYKIGNPLIALEADYNTLVEDRPIVCAEYPLPLLAKTDPCSSRTMHSLPAIAELLISPALVWLNHHFWKYHQCSQIIESVKCSCPKLMLLFINNSWHNFPVRLWCEHTE